ncbi:MAG: NADH-quinone oxidoreductase subunit L, partial [Chloroflexi bacterium]|nr:NADH-quinone oxidoreductase subunit L [Chloroflexota bacterium]
SFLLIALIIRPFFNKYNRYSGYTLIGALAAAFGLSVWVLTSSDHFPMTSSLEWMVVGNFNIHLGLWVDQLTAIMLVVVTGVSLLVQIYSQGYMHGDAGYARYFAFMSLFTMAMLGLVLASSLLLLFVFWELVGLCSYLLIGFWFHRPSAAAAAKKAFIVTRFGDFGLLAGILVLYFSQSTFEIHELNELAIAGLLGGTTLTLATLGIFSGAAGKSAQFPLHTWLPDAMEGPTPVSSLIHAATMVAAGVYLVARTLPMFAGSETAVTLVAYIGGFTAIFAASMGLVMNDIKRVIAYSTISQLGFMMLGLGTVGVAAAKVHGTVEAEELLGIGVAVGIFHLFTHSFFKCLLFLGSGSVNHTTGTFDMREMGGLRKHMPWTFFAFLLAAISLAGIWPLAGFWSKDEILVQAKDHTPVLFYLAMITVFMTAFYIFRVVFLTFSGEYRGGAQEAHSEHGNSSRPHESPVVMVLPMAVLAVLAISSGWLNVTGAFSNFMGHEVEGVSFIVGLFGVLSHPLPVISLLVALAGIFLAYAMYGARWISPEKVGKTFRPLYTTFLRKYWMDELYERVIVGKVLMSGLFAAFQKTDSSGVDGAVNGIAGTIVTAGGNLRKAQTGQLQLYALFIAIGLLAIALALVLL